MNARFGNLPLYIQTIVHVRNRTHPCHHVCAHCPLLQMATCYDWWSPPTRIHRMLLVANLLWKQFDQVWIYYWNVFGGILVIHHHTARYMISVGLHSFKKFNVMSIDSSWDEIFANNILFKNILKLCTCCSILILLSSLNLMIYILMCATSFFVLYL